MTMLSSGATTLWRHDLVKMPRAAYFGSTLVPRVLLPAVRISPILRCFLAKAIGLKTCDLGEIMKFRPLHDRVVVRRVEAETKTAGGIIVPDTAQEKPMEGEII